MAITKTKKPYEFLARWDDAGNLSGSHVVFRESITDDGVEISSKIGDASPVGIAGFPLLDILTALQADALAGVDAKTAQLAALTTEKAAAVTAREAADVQVVALTAQVQTLAALQEQVTVLTATAHTAVVAHDSVAVQAAALTDAMGVLTTEKDAAEAGKAAAIVTLTADKDAAVADKAHAETARDTAVAQAAALTEQVTALTAQLAALQPPVDSFSRKAIKIALSEAGLLEGFESFVAAPTDSADKQAMISWQEDDMFTKTSPALTITFAHMQLTDEQIAALFVAAGAL